MGGEEDSSPSPPCRKNPVIIVNITNHNLAPLTGIWYTAKGYCMYTVLNTLLSIKLSIGFKKAGTAMECKLLIMCCT